MAIFYFRAFLNLAMLLVESTPAKSLRQVMLDIVIDFINQKSGGATKYINQRDSAFLGAFLVSEEDATLIKLRFNQYFSGSTLFDAKKFHCLCCCNAGIF